MVNSTIVLRGLVEEIALPLNGEKRKLTKDLFLQYGQKCLELSEKTIEKTLENLTAVQNKWQDTLAVCGLSDDIKTKYQTLLAQRLAILS